MLSLFDDDNLSKIEAVLNRCIHTTTDPNKLQTYKKTIARVQSYYCNRTIEQKIEALNKAISRNLTKHDKPYPDCDYGKWYSASRSLSTAKIN